MAGLHGSNGSIGPKSTPAPTGVGGPVLGGDLGRVGDSKGRATPTGATFGSVLAAARPILKGAEAVASVLPGGPLIAAAVRGPTTLAGAGGAGYAKPPSPGGTSMTPHAPPAPHAPPVPYAPHAVSPGGGVEAPPSPGAGDHAGVESALADSQAFNLYYLQLQEQMSAENRGYTALSNVLKARHDTVKNAIGNIR